MIIQRIISSGAHSLSYWICRGSVLPPVSFVLERDLKARFPERYAARIQEVQEQVRIIPASLVASPYW
jgi:hypothetical protein